MIHWLILSPKTTFLPNFWKQVITLHTHLHTDSRAQDIHLHDKNPSRHFSACLKRKITTRQEPGSTRSGFQHAGNILESFWTTFLPTWHDDCDGQGMIPGAMPRVPHVWAGLHFERNQRFRRRAGSAWNAPPPTRVVFMPRHGVVGNEIVMWWTHMTCHHMRINHRIGVGDHL